MKALIAIAIVSFSFQSFAYETSLMSSISIYLTSASTSGHNPFLKAEEIIKDANEYNVSGDLTPALAEHIRNVQAENSDLSQVEAIDALTEQASIIINEK